MPGPVRRPRLRHARCFRRPVRPRSGLFPGAGTDDVICRPARSGNRPGRRRRICHAPSAGVGGVDRPPEGCDADTAWSPRDCRQRDVICGCGACGTLLLCLHQLLVRSLTIVHSVHGSRWRWHRKRMPAVLRCSELQAARSFRRSMRDRSRLPSGASTGDVARRSCRARSRPCRERRIRHAPAANAESVDLPSPTHRQRLHPWRGSQRLTLGRPSVRCGKSPRRSR